MIKILRYSVIAIAITACITSITSCAKKTDATSHCHNGIQDGNETGTDCGGDCATCPDPCANVNCQNGGTCLSGNCACVFGYMGMHCEREVRSVFIGSYICYDTIYSQGQPTTFTSISHDSITAGSDIRHIALGTGSSHIDATIGNQYGAGGTTHFDIPYQSIPSNYITHGEGNLDTVNNILYISISYSNNDERGKWIKQ